MSSQGKEKFFTIMVVPHSEGKVFSWKIPYFVLGLITFVLLGAIGSASFILTRYFDYELTKRANIRLTEKNAYFVQELSKTHEAFERVAKMEDELRAMLKMKTDKALLKYTGEGGPTLADQEMLMNTLNNRLTMTDKEFAKSLDVLQNKAQEQMESYHELKKYIATQRSLMASQPSIWPVRGWITSRFGSRHSPFFVGISFHNGIDIANEEGTGIKAPADGIVSYSGWQGSYGKLIVIDHGYGYSTRYGHLQRSFLTVGQKVRRGQVIAFLGSSGRSTAPHLHYEIRVQGVPVDPFKFLKP